jgi:hypothetical protein
MWGNDVNGDCCTAEEAFAKACNTPEIFVPDEEVIAWATRHGVLNGATGIDVLDWMQTDGFQMNASTYDDGPSTSVDWTNPTVLQSAISQGPVKTIISADQVENAYQLHQASGWIGTGFTQDENYDHCVSLCGYGQLGWLLGELGTEIPNNLDPQSPFYAMFTWNSIGAIDLQSLVAICGEAWIRNPTTVASGTVGQTGRTL